MFTEEPSIDFNVTIFSDAGEYADNISCCCSKSNATTANDAFADLNTPLLVTHSYLQGYDALAHIAPKGDDLRVSGINPIHESRRERRSAGTCRRLELQLDSTDIFTELYSDSVATTIVFPLAFDAGICGGDCRSDRSLPRGTTTYAPFISVLIQQNRFQSDYPSYSFRSTCTPILYRDLRVVTSNPSGGFAIVTIDSMRIDQCDCLHVV